MGAYHGAGNYELVELFLLNKLSSKFSKKYIGLCRDDELAVCKNIDGHQANKIRKKKKIRKLNQRPFKKSDLSLDIECNLKIVNYLDVTLNLKSVTYKAYCKPNETLYLHAKSNYSPNIIK